MTLLAVPTTGDDVGKMRRDVEAAAAVGADLVELRVDHLTDPDVEPPTDLGRGGGRLLVTCRPEWEGGKFRGDEDRRRRTLLRWADATGAAWVDVELRSLERSPWPEWERLRGRAVLSFHDYDGVPADLAGVLARMEAWRPAKLKLACRTDDARDAMRVLRMLESPPAGRTAGDIAALGMGDAGRMTRGLAAKFGAFLTFGALADNKRTAAGQTTAADLLGTYRFRSIRGSTGVCGVAGWPVAHSMSPTLHNAAFSAAGDDLVYVPFPIKPDTGAVAEALDAAFAFRGLGLRGLSVTIPHKETALAWARGREADLPDDVVRIGALNTLCRTEDGRLLGRNTDFLAIKELVGTAYQKDRHGWPAVLVLGAGGAARAAVAGVRAALDFQVDYLLESTPVFISNRTRERAEVVARDLGAHVVDWEERGRQGAVDFLINATSVGLTPRVEDTPFPAEHLRSRTIVLDTVYNPPETRLLREARQAGCPTIDGIAMFVEQAILQYELWTGRRAPREVMTAAVRRKLGLKN